MYVCRAFRDSMYILYAADEDTQLQDQPPDAQTSIGRRDESRSSRGAPSPAAAARSSSPPPPPFPHLPSNRPTPGPRSPPPSQHLSEAGAVPPGNAPGVDTWTARAAPPKPELRLTSGKGLADVTVPMTRRGDGRPHAHSSRTMTVNDDPRLNPHPHPGPDTRARVHSLTPQPMTRSRAPASSILSSRTPQTASSPL